MTLAYENNALSDVGRVHILCIGVGAYRYLKGGAEERPHVTDLGQLTSPPVSALHWARWLLENLNAEGRPIASIELSLSPAQTVDFGQGSRKVDESTRSSIQDAFEAWLGRCNADEKNLAVFYFCGHGLQRASQVLLASDFGRNANAWPEAINFDATYDGMSHCQANTQLFLIDACREWPIDKLDVLNPHLGTPLLEPKAGGFHRTAPILNAVGPDRTAFGDQNAPSNFVNMLTAGFEGLAADRRQGRWIIPADQLGVLLHEIHLASSITGTRAIELDGVFQLGARVLHVLNGAPTVPARIQCNPPGTTPDATLYLRRAGSAVDAHLSPRAPARRAWNVNVVAGSYDVYADFAVDPPGQKKLPDEFVRPGNSRLDIQVN